MAPINFEEHIKDKLGEREIAPSEGTWGKVASRLGNIPLKKKKKYYGYGIAAGLAVAIALSVWMVNRETEEQPQPETVVEVPATKAGTPLVEAPQKVTSGQETKEPLKTQPLLAGDTQIAVTSGQDNHNPKDKVTLQEAENEPELWEGSHTVIDKKVSELLSQVTALEQNAGAVSDAELDSLLRKAQEEIWEERIFTAKSKVDAMALLNEVEAELDASFRDQIFETLKRNFLKVRTAVADRNN